MSESAYGAERNRFMPIHSAEEDFAMQAEDPTGTAKLISWQCDARRQLITRNFRTDLMTGHNRGSFENM